MSYVRTATAALRDTGARIYAASRQLVRSEEGAKSWLSRVIATELARRAATHDAAHWDRTYPGLTPEQRADARIRRMLMRATAAGVLGAAGASAAQIASASTDGAAAPIAVPLGLLSIGADVLYTTTLQIDVAFDLASIYRVPFAEDDIGEVATLLALPLGVAFRGEAEREPSGAARQWRSVASMYGDDFADAVAGRIVGVGVLRDVLPIAGVVVSAVGAQLHLRRYARHVHRAMRHRRAIASAARRAQLGDSHPAARTIVEGAWLMASGCGPLGLEEALVLSTLIERLPLPERTEIDEARFHEDEEGWLEEARALDPNSKRALLDVLVIVASADGELDVFEQRFLRRAARALGREIDLTAVEREHARLREGDVAGLRDEWDLPLELAGSMSRAGE